MHAQCENIEKGGAETLSGPNSASSGQEIRGVLNRTQFDQALRSAFPALDDVGISKMVELAVQELELSENDMLIEYKTLFMEDEEGRTGPFLEAILDYLKGRRLDYVERFIQTLINPGYFY